MEIRLKTACTEDAPRLNEMQKRTFLPLSQKYNDVEGSPAFETVDRTLERITSPGCTCHILLADECYAGMLCVRRIGNGMYKISPVFVLPEFQNRGIAQKAFSLLDSLYPDAELWRLSTIREEARNCHLYEKLGYVKTGLERKINDQMTIIGYERRVLK